MRRVLVTGMSGVGKSTIARGLAARGFRAVDTDEDGVSRWIDVRTGVPAHPPEAGAPWGDVDFLWDQGRMAALLEADQGDALFICGSAANQVTFYPSFDHIVLVSVPRDVMLERLASRATNPFGKDPVELAKVLADVERYEPKLRRAAGYEIDGSRPIDEVLNELARIALA